MQGDVVNEMVIKAINITKKCRLDTKKRHETQGKTESKNKLFKRRRLGNLAVVAADQNLNSLFLFRGTLVFVVRPSMAVS